MAERPSLVRLARRIIGDAALAKDITQNLWLRIQRIADPAVIQDRKASHAEEIIAKLRWSRC